MTLDSRLATVVEAARSKKASRIRLVDVGAIASFTDTFAFMSGGSDRQNRAIIEMLQDKGYPIVASSGTAGYVLAADEATTEAYIAELVSREENLRNKIRSVRASKRWIPFIREWRANKPAKQDRVF